MKDFGRLALILATMLPALISGACGASENNRESTDLLSAAAAEATAIVEQAQATALVLQAQAQATAMVAQANSLSPSPMPAPTLALALTGGDQQEATPTPAPQPEDEPAPTPLQTVEVTGVGFAGEGGLILVRFRAPPEVTEQWWQGSVVVTDEATGAVYNEIPVMPKIGPLIGRPKVDGQIGYVMLVNPPPYLQSGAVVTVKLGNYTFEHVSVQ
jgi:hypothetical protein